MPRDYAKKKASKKNKRGASRGSKKATVPLSLWLFTVVAVLALASGLFYLKWEKPQPKPSPSVTKQPVKPQKTSQSQPDVSFDDEEVPFYDVHKDLTNKQVEIPKEDLKLPDNYKKFYYTMPCGSFRDSSRADELKALIAMTGNNSNISSVQWQDETWYRVQLGPFNSKRTAEKVRHRLQDNGIHDCKINSHLKQ